MSNSKPVVLVIDDELQVQRLLRMALEDEECQVLLAGTGREGLLKANTSAPDVIFLDLGLPDIGGLEVLEQLRAWCTVPVIVLSARGEEAIKIAALDGGADDYLTKPFRIPELQARLRVALRHRQRRLDGDASALVEIGDLKVDLSRRQVWSNGAEVRLTPIEYKLLAYMAKHRGMVLTHQMLLREVWGETYVGEISYLRVFMRQLRQKIEKDPAQPKYLETAARIGYRLRDSAGA